MSASDVSEFKLLRGRKGLVAGIANEHSIAWGCARAFHRLGADLAITYLNEKAKPFVEPLSRQVDASILMPLDLRGEGQLEALFGRIERDWGRLDFLLHSIAFAPKEALHGRVVDVPREGFLQAMEVSCWSFIRMAKLAELLMSNGGAAVHHELLRQPNGCGELQCDGAGEGGAGGKCALPRCRAGPQGHPGQRDLSRPAEDARRLRHPRVR